MQPAAITLDVMMPDMDGWSVLSALKADASLRDIPVIMLTMVADAGVVQRCLRAGALNYILKSHATDTIRRILRDVFPRSGKKEDEA